MAHEVSKLDSEAVTPKTGRMAAYSCGKGLKVVYHQASSDSLWCTLYVGPQVLIQCIHFCRNSEPCDSQVDARAIFG